MPLGQSKVTSQGQISVPAGIRRRLGIGPGSILEWEQEGDRIVVRRAGRFTAADIHRAVFPEGVVKSRSLAQLKDGIRQRMRERYAGR